MKEIARESQYAGKYITSGEYITSNAGWAMQKCKTLTLFTKLAVQWSDTIIDSVLPRIGRDSPDG
jgi:hypothetical protein